MLKKLSKRELILLAIFIEFLLVTFIVNSWLIPSIEKKDDLMIDRNNLQQQWNEVKSYKGQEDELQENIIQLNEDIKKIQTKIPVQTSSYLYWEELLDTAMESDVEIILLQEGEQSAPAYLMNTILSYQGTYEACLLFLENLKALPYLYSVKEGSFTEVDGREVMTSISLQFYFQTTDPIYSLITADDKAYD